MNRGDDAENRDNGQQFHQGETGPFAVHVSHNCAL